MNRPDSARPKTGRKSSAIPRTATASTASRPVTQQGLSGIRPAQTPMSAQTRIHKDRRYYASLIQVHERDIREEITTLKKQTEEYKSLSAKQEEYKKMAEKLAKQCNDSQEELNVYNTVLSTYLSKTKEEDVIQETIAYKQKNEELSHILDDIIAKKTILDEAYQKLEKEIKASNEEREKEVEKLSPDDRIKYKSMAKENKLLLKSLFDLKTKVSIVQEQLGSIEETVSESKKQKIKLLEEKEHYQEQISSIEQDINDTETPEKLQTKLLNQVKNDRSDIETLMKVQGSLEQELKSKLNYVAEMDSEMDAKNKDRLKKLKDLRERGEDMKKFIDESKQSIPEMEEKLKSMCKNIEAALEHASISTVDLKSFDDEYDESKLPDNEDNLNEIYTTLKQKYTRIVKLGNMYKCELENLKKSNEDMKNEMANFQNADALREQLLEKKNRTEEKKRELEQTLKTTEDVIENAKKESETLNAKLKENKVYEVIKNMEKELEEAKNENNMLQEKIMSVDMSKHYLNLVTDITKLVDSVNNKLKKDLDMSKNKIINK